jgi:hypothetical protein
MSALLVSALAMTALAVPPSFGSEPYVFGFESPPAAERTPAQTNTRAPLLAASLGSEPLLPGFDVVTPETPAHAARPDAEHADAGSSLLAASLGSEPFLPGAPESASTPAAAPREVASARAPQEALARSCSCR